MTATTTDLDYVRICGGCQVDGDFEWFCGTVAMFHVACTRCGHKGHADDVFYPKANHPRMAGFGPVGTTGVTVATYPPVVWDVRRYYLDLGVTPRATKKEIREAYQALDGQSSPRLTFVVKQLLNDEIRAAYDAVKLGDEFMDDEVIAWVEAQMADHTAKLRASGQEFKTERIDLSHLRHKAMKPGAKQPLDTDGLSDQAHTYAWRWYRWMTASNDTAKLREWHELLLRAFAERGLETRIAVGLKGGLDATYEVAEVGHHLVAFVGTSARPNPAMANAVAGAVEATFRSA